jgi:hypothetical protein
MIKWHIVNTDKRKQGELNNVIYKVYWNCVDEVETEDPETSGSRFGIVLGITEVSLDTTTPFTEYQNITTEQLLNWVYQSVDKSAIEAEATSNIN